MLLLMDNSWRNIIFRNNRGRFVFENGSSNRCFSLWIIAGITLSLGLIEAVYAWKWFIKAFLFLMDNSQHNIIFRINRGRFMLENGLSKRIFSLWIIVSITLSLGLIVGDLCLKMVHQNMLLINKKFVVYILLTWFYSEQKG